MCTGFNTLSATESVVSEIRESMMVHHFAV